MIITNITKKQKVKKLKKQIQHESDFVLPCYTTMAILRSVSEVDRIGLGHMVVFEEVFSPKSFLSSLEAVGLCSIDIEGHIENLDGQGLHRLITDAELSLLQMQ